MIKGKHDNQNAIRKRFHTWPKMRTVTVIHVSANDSNLKSEANERFVMCARTAWAEV